MTLSIWRYAHLVLAIISAAFLFILAITGVILAFDAVQERSQAYKAKNFEQISLAESLTTLRDSYLEVIEVQVDYNDFVTVQAIDEDGNSINSYTNPITGERIADVKPKNQFIQWTTALHRSLFLKETGRIIIGVVSFILLLITISGFVLILKRQKGLRNFFSKVNRDFFSVYFHVVSGRLLLIPVLLIALTGTLIFVLRLNLFQEEVKEFNHKSSSVDLSTKALNEIPFFQNTKLADVKRIEFPFIPDDEDEPFIVHLKDRTVTVNQVNGAIITESQHPFSVLFEELNLDLHTGRTNIIWAIILGIASLNILFFIYSGFIITFKRTKTKIKNKFKANQAEVVILYGSENGTTLFFVNQIQKQLISLGIKVYLAEMNKYELYPNAKQLLIFTSTYGLGDAPTNASMFKKLLLEQPQTKEIQYAVVGFGSKSYVDFCSFAAEVDSLLSEQDWTKQLLPLHTVNDRSADDFVKWTEQWSNLIPALALATSPAIYNAKIPGLKKFTLVTKKTIEDDSNTYILTFKTPLNQKYESGDLLAVYPKNDSIERFYSIGKSKKKIQLLVKLIPNGIGSNYLYNLEIGSTIKARVLKNEAFHFPKKTKNVALIANGTGIAPFLGMIEENTNNTAIRLYVGFRNQNSLVNGYKNFAKEMQKVKRLEHMHIAYSREGNKSYVMDLIHMDALYFADLLKNNGVVMICGSLLMQKDVENVLTKICIEHNNQDLQYYKQNNQILTDCY